MKSEISSKVDHELVDKWSSKVLNVWPLDKVITFKRICAELSRRDWGEKVIAHIYDLTLTDTEASRYVRVSQYPHDADTWASTMWGLHQLGYTEVVEMLRDCTNTPAQVRCPVCGKFMSADYTRSYSHVQGVEEFYHRCYGFHNKVRRSFRYVPGHGWCEIGTTRRTKQFDKATKDKIEETIRRIIDLSHQRAIASSELSFARASERYIDECKVWNELYDILGMKEYKYDV